MSHSITIRNSLGCTRSAKPTGRRVSTDGGTGKRASSNTHILLGNAITLRENELWTQGGIDAVGG